MADRYLRMQCDPLEKVAGHTFERSGSVLDWRRALFVGNGDIGAAVHGFPDNLTFHIGKTDIWWDNRDPGYTYPAFGLDELRQRLAAGDESVKREVRRAAEGNRGAAPNQTACARLTLQVCRSAVFHHVKERLNPLTGVAECEFSVGQHGPDGGPWKIQSFAARLEEVLVIRLLPAGGNWGTVRFELSRDPMEPGGDGKRWLDGAEMDRRHQPRAETEGNLAWFIMELSGGDGFTAMLATDMEGPQIGAVGPDIFGRCRPQHGALTFYLAVVSTRDAEDPTVEARLRVEHALTTGYDCILSEHRTWWKRYWGRSWISLPTQAHERPWYWGLYKAASARRPGKVCPAYCAPWLSGNYPAWGFYILTFEMTHVNLGLLPTNRAELLEPWFSLLHRARDRVRECTRRFYGLEGVCYPHCLTFEGEVVPSIGIYNSTIMNLHTAGEAVKYAWDYYDYTGDLDFLERIGYPLLKEVAVFYRAYLQEDEKGRLVIFPSRYLEYDSYTDSLDDYMLNSIIDLATFRLTLQCAAAAAEALGTDLDLAASWREAADRLASYACWPDGSWKPSQDWKSAGRHPCPGAPELGDLWPISVTGEVDAWHGSAELRQQARATYSRLLGHHPRPWDMVFSAIAAARMGDRGLAGKILDLLPEQRDGGNLNRGDSPDFKPGSQELQPDGQHSFNVDKGSACPAEVITEFLLQSHGGDIRLFPAAPLEGTYGFHSLRARGAFLVSAELRDGRVPYVLIQSLAGNPCRVMQPFGESCEAQVRDLDTGEQVCARTYTADEPVEFATEAGHIYVVDRADCPLEQVPMIEA